MAMLKVLKLLALLLCFSSSPIPLKPGPNFQSLLGYPYDSHYIGTPSLPPPSTAIKLASLPFHMTAITVVEED